jgi:hypothetical protein
MRRYVVIDIVVGFLVPLVPAVLLYELFTSLNSASVIQDNKGIKLGGPAALYVVLLVLALRYMNRWRTNMDPLAKLKKDLVGTWDVTSESSNGRKAVSSSKFRLDDNNNLILAGGSFVEEGRTIGNWTPDHIILDPSPEMVIFLYDLKDASAGVNSRGLMELTMGSDTRLSMQGTWEVFGKEYHSGTVTFVMRPKGNPAA